EPMLAVDDEEFRLRLGQMARALRARDRLEAQLLGGEQQYRSGDRRLGDRRLIEILELAHLGPGQGSLEGAVVALDFGDELGGLGALSGLWLLRGAVQRPAAPEPCPRHVGSVADTGAIVLDLPGCSCATPSRKEVASYPSGKVERFSRRVNEQKHQNRRHARPR